MRPVAIEGHGGTSKDFGLVDGNGDLGVGPVERRNFQYRPARFRTMESDALDDSGQLFELVGVEDFLLHWRLVTIQI